jgi:hypothetical protein
MSDNPLIGSPKMATATRSQKTAADVSALLRARNPLLWIVTREEARIESYLIQAAASAGYVPRTWDVAGGLTEIDGRSAGVQGSNDPGAALTEIADRSDKGRERGLWIMRDLAPWLTGPGGLVTQRQLRNLVRALPARSREQAQAVVVLTTSAEVPAELAGHTSVIEWPLPDRDEIAAILDAALDAQPAELKISAAPDGTRDAAVDAAVGLAGEEAAACYAQALVRLRRIDPLLVAREKKRVIARERVLEWFDPLPGGLDAIGGLDQLKAWLLSRASAYSPKARAYGLPAPKGALLVGVPGCGKSMTAKAIAAAWGVPLLRFDVGALRSKFVGESEANIRKAFRVVEALGRCIVWLDEIEKALQGATSGSADGGVSADALGSILSWMQERQGDAFIIATANDVSVLPPELMRKGRFDEIFFVDLPTTAERVSVLAATLRTFGRNDAAIAIAEIAAACDGFTGSEIAALVPDAMFAAFADGERELRTADLLQAAKSVVPLAKVASEKIKQLRDWASGRARPAASIEAPAGQRKGLRAIDL